jgi:8-oxo-dGTP pyrophosphatase MutT (NUDIX family)
MSKYSNVCNNCGKQGHLFNQCKLPIISYGVIVYRYNNDKIEYLMIRRKDSFGYIDFIRGKYLIYNIFQLQNIINEMSINEKNKILNEPFDKLWKDMWGETTHSQYKNEEMVSGKKFDIIKNGIEIDNKHVRLSDIIDNSNTNWDETEWEFPKGRRNFKEKDLDCALREFEEETGLSKNDIKIIDNIIPFEETFIGTNHKSYKHKYFLAYANNLDLCNLTNFQKTEVSKLEWKTYEQCLQSIRPYNLEKQRVIQNVNSVLQEYKIIPIYI